MFRSEMVSSWYFEGLIFLILLTVFLKTWKNDKIYGTPDLNEIGFHFFAITSKIKEP